MGPTSFSSCSEVYAGAASGTACAKTGNVATLATAKEIAAAPE
jgi:hypothetical protein